MKELDLQLAGYPCKDNMLVKIDGVPIKFTRNKNKNLICKYQIEEEKVEIEIFKLLDVGGFFWFITQLFFFIITIFGLLDAHHKERCLVIDFEIEVELKEKSELTFHFNTLKENQRPIEIETNSPAIEISNVVLVDTNAKKVIKNLKIAKILFVIATIIIGIIIVTAII